MHWADRNLKSLGDFDALISGDSCQGATAASEKERRLAAALIDRGLAPSDRVLIWMPNGADLIIAWRAVVRAGGITVVAHHDAPLKRIEQLIAETAPAIIITDRDIDALIDATSVRTRILSRAKTRDGWLAIPDLIAATAPLTEPVAREPDDIASIVHTSGTTAEPKGLVTRHSALTGRLKKSKPWFATVRRPVRHLVLLPMASTFGSYAFTHGLTQKCSLHFLDSFNPENALKTIEHYRIHQTFLVPAMCEAMLALPDARDYDVSSLRSVVCSGAPVSAELAARFRSTFGVRLEVGYGMSGVGVVSRTAFSSRPGSVGRMRKGLRARVEDADGTALPRGEIGELVLKLGNGAAVEHWNADSSVTSLATPGKWYRTGDLVRFDSRGELHVIGRGDDLIIQAGHNIHGNFVAEVVQRLGGVRECAVVGVPSDYLGQEAVACVAVNHDARLTAADILAHCRLNLESGSVPGSVWFVRSLPRTELGKIKAHELRSAIRTSRGMKRETKFLLQLREASAESRGELMRAEIRRLVGDVLQRNIEDGSTTFRNMGLDSLGSVEVTHALSESVGRPLPATMTYAYPTVEAVSVFVLGLLDLNFRKDNSTGEARPSRRTRAKVPRLGEFFSSGELAKARELNAASRTANRPPSILLTGASGFLGRFLALEILGHFQQAPGSLVCIVRAPDNSSARERLRRAYASDPILQNRFDALSCAGRLTVLAGDFTKPHFGLDDATHDLLSADVDCVIHNGAIVDHVLGYDELYAPNVLGTVEVIRFALTSRAKCISYVSSIAARDFTSARFLGSDSGIAAGYVAGKWASENLLKELNENHGLPVRIFRPSQILAHDTYRGQVNTRDTLTRLLQGIVMTSLAPPSFYERQRGSRTRHFDGLPVNIVAQRVAAGSIDWSGNSSEYSEYNLVNEVADVDLDTIVKWVSSAGYRVERPDEYSEWHREFVNRLGSLTGTARQNSLLPLAHAWERPLRRGGDAPGSFDRLPGEGVVDEAFIHKCLDDMALLGLL